MRQVYEVTVRRDGRWWMVEIPSIRGITQARQLEDVEESATSYIAVNQDKPLGDIGIEIVDINVPALGKAGEHLLEKVARTKQRRAELVAKAQELSAKAASAFGDHIMTLADRSLSLDERLSESDIGFLFGVSKPWVNKIVKAEAAKAQEAAKAATAQATASTKASSSQRVSAPSASAQNKTTARKAATPPPASRRASSTAAAKKPAAGSARTKRA